MCIYKQGYIVKQCSVFTVCKFALCKQNRGRAYIRKDTRRLYDSDVPSSVRLCDCRSSVRFTFCETLSGVIYLFIYFQNSYKQQEVQDKRKVK